ncbi:MAG: DUF364 domain-containing protein [Methanomicrobiales archaeon]|nr:DUF364 domain-containing protein [Methanomicrobiales archaeon]
MTSPLFRPGSILDETIEQVRGILGSDAKSLRIERVVIGIFFAGVKLSDGSAGIAATPVKEIPEAVCCPSSARAMPLSGRFTGRAALEFVRNLHGQPPMKKAVGIAVLNALSESCRRRSPDPDCMFEIGTDALESIPLPEEGCVVVVGALVPVLKRLKVRNKPFGILELDLRTLKPDELPFAIPPERADEAVGRADLLVITGTTLLNNTLEPLLARAKPGAEIVVVGPTAGLLPDAFFRRGVTVLGGITVTRPDELLGILAEGGSGYHFFGKSAEKVNVHRQKPS